MPPPGLAYHLTQMSMLQLLGFSQEAADEYMAWHDVVPEEIERWSQAQLAAEVSEARTSRSHDAWRRALTLLAHHRSRWAAEQLSDLLELLPTELGTFWDLAFAEAVAHGYLSVQQAIERGDRDRFVKRLVDRHGISESLALMVADNKTSLTMALRKDREEVAEILRPMQVAVWKKALGAAIAGLAVVAVGIYGINVWSGIEADTRKVEEWAETVSSKAEKERKAEIEAQAKEPKRTVPQRRVRILRDEEGRMLEIEGPDPSSILLAYCVNQEPDGRYRPLELTVPDPPFPGHKLGVFTDEADLGKRYAITIRRTIQGRRWIASGGEQPIRATDAPMRSHDKAAVPVVVNQEPSSDS